MGSIGHLVGLGEESARLLCQRLYATDPRPYVERHSAYYVLLLSLRSAYRGPLPYAPTRQTHTGQAFGDPVAPTLQVVRALDRGKIRQTG